MAEERITMDEVARQSAPIWARILARLEALESEGRWPPPAEPPPDQ